MKQSIISFAVISLLMTSCATVFTGTKDRISFKTTPPGATIFINGVEQCKSPCSVNVSRKISDKDVEIKLDGYETKIITLDKEFNVVSILNLANILFWAIDAVTGAVMKYDKKAYDIELSKNKKVGKFFPNKININTETKVAEIYIIEK